MKNKPNAAASNPDLAEVLRHASTDKRIEILRRIDEGGSISEAARRTGVSYKAAWQALETLDNLAGTALVDKAVGGSGGGGAVLTAAGQRVLDAATRLDAARTGVLNSLARGVPAAGRGGAGLAALALRTSMRNQFPCVVKTLARHAGLVRVGLELHGGARLHARITNESAQLLQLERGLPVLALCKATAVRIAERIRPAHSRNLLHGSVVRIVRSAAGGEVVLRLEGSLSLVGLNAASAALEPGQAAMAGVDESAIVVATPG